MAFNELKSKHGTRVIQAVAIYPNACKYSTEEAMTKGVCYPVTQRDSTWLGSLNVTALPTTDLSFFSGNTYIKFDTGEIAKCTIQGAATIEITSRGEFGTVAGDINAGTEARVLHSGEADGSCRGYPRRPDGKGCSTADSFDRNVTREFLITDTQLIAGEIYYNGLQSISHNPVILKPGESLAKNASVNVSIQDNTDDDQYAVPYQSVRTSTSTYLRKLLARTGGYLRNRRMVVYSGFTENSTFDPANCISREYIIDDFNINSDDRVTIRGLDPLALAEEVKAKTHDVSAGLLNVAITDASTEINLRNFAVGEYGNDGDTGTVQIDSELIDYTVASSTAGTLTINARGVGGSQQKDHAINASVQWCLTYENYNPINVIVGILQSRTTLESRFFGDYSAAISVTPPNSGKVYIGKPETMKNFINDIVKSWAENNIAIYFDELSKQIKIKAAGDFEQQQITLTDVDFLQNSVEIDNLYQEQVTRASIGFAPFDASKKTNEDNASIIYQSINIGLEQNGTLEPQEDKTLYSRYLTDSDTDVGIAVGGIGRIANVNQRPPQQYKFTIDYEKYGDVNGARIEEGEIINATTELAIDDDGQPKSENLQIVSIRDDMENKRVTVTAKLYQDIVNQQDFDFIIDEDKENYVLSDDFAPTEAGEYTVFIASNVTIGSTSTSVFAFDTGTQAAGVTLRLVWRGNGLGAGGGGGSAGFAIAANPNDLPSYDESESDPGSNGGDAINITVPTTIDVTQGIIYAGGGGAPSGISVANSIGSLYTSAGDGGSGGQGYVGGQGGSGGLAYVEPNQLRDEGVDGNAGSRAAPGSLGGLSGGAWGEDGETSAGLAAGGQAGFAIRSNGNPVTIIGDNDATVRGQRDF